MEPSRTALVFYKQHLAMQINQRIADVLRRLGTQTGSLQLLLIAHQPVVPFLHFDLRIELRTEEIDIAVMRVQRIFLRPFGVITQHISEEIGADIRLRQSIPVQTNTLRAEVVIAVRKSRNEMTAETPHIRLLHLPDTEETEDMIHTVCVEIVLHLAETSLPPTEVILRHLVPVISREAPVLTANREIIGRRTGRSVQIEQLRINGCIDAVRADSDRYVTLHRYADRVRVSHSVSQLFVRMELQELIEIFRLFVAFVQELRIRLQPRIVLLDKRLVCLAAEKRVFVLFV